MFDNGVEHPSVKINTPFLTTKTAGDAETYDDQKIFRKMVDEFYDADGKKSLIVRSRYGSGKTTFTQRLIDEKKAKRVLFITYRQTLARDNAKKIKKLGFKNYLDSYDDPRVWDAPRLIVQVDSLLKLTDLHSSRLHGESMPKYGLIVLDESESLLQHFDEETMNKKEIPTWELFNDILATSRKIVLMDGDMSERSLSFIGYYGQFIHINNLNNETNKTLNIACDKAIWEAGLDADIEKFYKEYKNFRTRIVSQTSDEVTRLEEDLKE